VILGSLLSYFHKTSSLTDRGVFLNNRYMDNLLLNRMNSRQGIVKKKQETIFEISIGCLHDFKILLKIQSRYTPIFSNDP
jgi:hypothetical protein